MWTGRFSCFSQGGSYAENRIKRDALEAIQSVSRNATAAPVQDEQEHRVREGSSDAEMCSSERPPAPSRTRRAGFRRSGREAPHRYHRRAWACKGRTYTSPTSQSAGRPATGAEPEEIANASASSRSRSRSSSPRSSSLGKTAAQTLLNTDTPISELRARFTIITGSR